MKIKSAFLVTSTLIFVPFYSMAAEKQRIPTFPVSSDVEEVREEVEILKYESTHNPLIVVEPAISSQTGLQTLSKEDIERLQKSRNIRLKRDVTSLNDTNTTDPTPTYNPSFGEISASGCAAWLNGNIIHYSDFDGTTSDTETCSITIPVLDGKGINNLKVAHHGSYQVTRYVTYDPDYDSYDYSSYQYTNAKLIVTYSGCGLGLTVQKSYSPGYYDEVTRRSFTYENSFTGLTCNDTDTISMTIKLSIENNGGYNESLDSFYRSDMELDQSTLTINPVITSGASRLDGPFWKFW